MIPLALFPERIQAVFTPTPRGVVGLVDDLLELCRDHDLRLDFQDGHCSIRSLELGVQSAINIPLPKSVFRAVLARVAALCNSQVPNSVTPYGGNGELSHGTNPPTIFRIAFINTPSEQRLEIADSGVFGGDAVKSQDLLELLRTRTVPSIPNPQH